MKGKQLRSNTEVLGDILSRRVTILTLLSNEDIDVYLFLLDRLIETSGKISEDHLFQFLFRSYYRLDNAGLSAEFKLAYFKLMEECYSDKTTEIRKICIELSNYTNLKHQNTLQFSFASKLVAMIDPRQPMYDLYVGKMFGFNPPGYGRSINERLNGYVIFYQRLAETIGWIADYQDFVEFRILLGNVLKNWNRLSTTKQCDFILWAAGKAREREKAKNRKAPNKSLEPTS